MMILQLVLMAAGASALVAPLGDLATLGRSAVIMDDFKADCMAEPARCVTRPGKEERQKICCEWARQECERMKSSYGTWAHLEDATNGVGLEGSCCCEIRVNALQQVQQNNAEGNYLKFSKISDKKFPIQAMRMLLPSVRVSDTGKNGKVEYRVRSENEACAAEGKNNDENINELWRQMEHENLGSGMAGCDGPSEDSDEAWDEYGKRCPYYKAWLPYGLSFLHGPGFAHMQGRRALQGKVHASYAPYWREWAHMESITTVYDGKFDKNHWCSKDWDGLVEGQRLSEDTVKAIKGNCKNMRTQGGFGSIAYILGIDQFTEYKWEGCHNRVWHEDPCCKFDGTDGDIKIGKKALWFIIDNILPLIPGFNMISLVNWAKKVGLGNWKKVHKALIRICKGAKFLHSKSKFRKWARYAVIKSHKVARAEYQNSLVGATFEALGFNNVDSCDPDAWKHKRSDGGWSDLKRGNWKSCRHCQDRPGAQGCVRGETPRFVDSSWALMGSVLSTVWASGKIGAFGLPAALLQFWPRECKKLVEVALEIADDLKEEGEQMADCVCNVIDSTREWRPSMSTSGAQCLPNIQCCYGKPSLITNKAKLVTCPPGAGLFEFCRMDDKLDIFGYIPSFDHAKIGMHDGCWPTRCMEEDGDHRWSDHLCTDIFGREACCGDMWREIRQVPCRVWLWNGPEALDVKDQIQDYMDECTSDDSIKQRCPGYPSPDRSKECRDRAGYSPNDLYQGGHVFSAFNIDWIFDPIIDPLQDALHRAIRGVTVKDCGCQEAMRQREACHRAADRFGLGLTKLIDCMEWDTIAGWWEDYIEWADDCAQTLANCAHGDGNVDAAGYVCEEWDKEGRDEATNPDKTSENDHFWISWGQNKGSCCEKEALGDDEVGWLVEGINAGAWGQWVPWPLDSVDLGDRTPVHPPSMTDANGNFCYEDGSATPDYEGDYLNPEHMKYCCAYMCRRSLPSNCPKHCPSPSMAFECDCKLLRKTEDSRPENCGEVCDNEPVPFEDHMGHRRQGYNGGWLLEPGPGFIESGVLGHVFDRRFASYCAPSIMLNNPDPKEPEGYVYVPWWCKWDGVALHPNGEILNIRRYGYIDQHYRKEYPKYRQEGGHNQWPVLQAVPTGNTLPNPTPGFDSRAQWVIACTGDEPWATRKGVCEGQHFPGTEFNTVMGLDCPSMPKVYGGVGYLQIPNEDYYLLKRCDLALQRLEAGEGGEAIDHIVGKKTFKQAMDTIKDAIKFERRHGYAETVLGAHGIAEQVTCTEANAAFELEGGWPRVVVDVSCDNYYPVYHGINDVDSKLTGPKRSYPFNELAHKNTGWDFDFSSHGTNAMRSAPNRGRKWDDTNHFDGYKMPHPSSLAKWRFFCDLGTGNCYGDSSNEYAETEQDIKCGIGMGTGGTDKPPCAYHSFSDDCRGKCLARCRFLSDTQYAEDLSDHDRACVRECNHVCWAEKSNSVSPNKLDLNPKNKVKISWSNGGRRALTIDERARVCPTIKRAFGFDPMCEETGESVCAALEDHAAGLEPKMQRDYAVENALGEKETCHCRYMPGADCDSGQCEEADFVFSDPGSAGGDHDLVCYGPGCGEFQFVLNGKPETPCPGWATVPDPDDYNNPSARIVKWGCHEPSWNAEMQYPGQLMPHWRSAPWFFIYTDDVTGNKYERNGIVECTAPTFDRDGVEVGCSNDRFPAGGGGNAASGFFDALMDALVMPGDRDNTDERKQGMYRKQGMMDDEVAKVIPGMAGYAHADFVVFWMEHFASVGDAVERCRSTWGCVYLMCMDAFPEGHPSPKAGKGILGCQGSTKIDIVYPKGSSWAKRYQQYFTYLVMNVNMHHMEANPPAFRRVRALDNVHSCKFGAQQTQRVFESKVDSLGQCLDLCDSSEKCNHVILENPGEQRKQSRCTGCVAKPSGHRAGAGKGKFGTYSLVRSEHVGEDIVFNNGCVISGAEQASRLLADFKCTDVPLRKLANKWENDFPMILPWFIAQKMRGRDPACPEIPQLDFTEVTWASGFFAEYMVYYRPGSTKPCPTTGLFGLNVALQKLRLAQGKGFMDSSGTLRLDNCRRRKCSIKFQAQIEAYYGRGRGDDATFIGYYEQYVVPYLTGPYRGTYHDYFFAVCSGIYSWSTVAAGSCPGVPSSGHACHSPAYRWMYKPTWSCNQVPIPAEIEARTTSSCTLSPP